MTVSGKLQEISLVDWFKLLTAILAIAVGAGIWWQNQNAEGKNLAQQLNTQSEIFADRISNLSNRLTSMETKQATTISDLGDVKRDVAIIARDVSFLAESIKARGVERDRQMEELQDNQEELNRQMNQKYDKLNDAISDIRGFGSGYKREDGNGGR